MSRGKNIFPPCGVGPFIIVARRPAPLQNWKYPHRWASRSHPDGTAPDRPTFLRHKLHLGRKLQTQLCCVKFIMLSFYIKHKHSFCFLFATQVQLGPQKRQWDLCETEFHGHLHSNPEIGTRGKFIMLSFYIKPKHSFCSLLATQVQLGPQKRVSQTITFQSGDWNEE